MRRGRAPGKVLLLGEHAVVYGHPALAAAVPLYVTVDVSEAPEPRLDLPRLATSKEILQAAVAIAQEAGFKGGFHARVQSELPLGSGLGSSAALGVALARAFKPGCGAEEAARLAMHLEEVLHGAPSGVDPAACAHGGIICFRRGDPPRVEQARHAGKIWLCVALTGIARGTRSTVLPLAERRKSDPGIDVLLQRLGALAAAARRPLVENRLDDLGALMDEAHALLRELGVSCPELEDAVAALKSAGASGAKLTGAGGGGAAIGLARGEEHAREMAARLGARAFAIEAGGA
jgi:mevalonate kinase